MPATSDGPAWAINPPAAPPPADAPLPSKAGALARAHCRVTGHTGDWTYPDGQCVRIRMCQRCGEITSKQEHAWSPFEYVAAARCEQERRCDRCGAQAKTRVTLHAGELLFCGHHYREHAEALAHAVAVPRSL